jgi:hypothetical protein
MTRSASSFSPTLRLSFSAGDIHFDTSEEAESALAGIASRFEALGWSVRTGETWFTATSAEDAQSGYTLLGVPSTALVDFLFADGPMEAVR